MSKIVIFGGGAWGRSLGFVFAKAGNCVKIVSRRNLAEFLNKEPFLGLELKQAKSAEDIKGAEFAVIAIASSALQEWLKAVKKSDSIESSLQNSAQILQNARILCACKGIFEGKFIHQILAQNLGQDLAENAVFLGGPSFAAEVLAQKPSALNLHSKNEKIAAEFCALFPKFIKPYICSDVLGGEIGGAYKNVIAIASGICEGLNLGQNARASLVARGLVEIERFGVSLGAESATFLGLSGAGDLFLSASSILSRNFRVGLGLAQNKPLSEILKDLGEVAEGVNSALQIAKMSKEREIYTPIATQVALVINGKSPKDALNDLMKHQ